MERNIVLRLADYGDVHDLFSWRNADVVRKQCFDVKEVTFHEHELWFRGKLDDPQTVMFIAINNREKIGVVRFMVQEQHATVSINLAPHLIGKGFGQEVIREGTARLFKLRPSVNNIQAMIKSSNEASKAVFSKAGYCIKSIASDVVTYICEKNKEGE